MKPTKSRTAFSRFAKWTSHVTGRPAAFGLAVIIIGAWAVTGPLFDYNDTWQLAINTGTTIVTFLMVFLIQSTQNRDTQALQVKLDELIRVTEGAHTVLLDLEEMEEEELDRIRARYARIAALSRDLRRQGVSDTGAPDLEVD